MLSSKTHEIISIPRFIDPIEAYTEFYIKGNMDYLVNSDMSINFVQRREEEWRVKLNYAWFIACGFLPFKETVSVSCLPTIDFANFQNYFFDEIIYSCPYKKPDIMFDYSIDKNCPNCGTYHKESEMHILRLQYLWSDFPIFATIDDIGKDLKNIMKKVTKLNYPHSRLRSTL